MNLDINIDMDAIRAIGYGLRTVLDSTPVLLGPSCFKSPMGNAAG